MDTLESELKELKAFIADLKADRATQKEKEKREGWTKFVSMSLVFIAVIAAVATQWAGKYSGRTLTRLNDSTYYQSLATDKWSYYQANSIKLNLLETIHNTTPNDPASANFAKLEKTYADKVEKYSSTKDKTAKEAAELEQQRDAARNSAAESSARGGKMGRATSIFQISIAMGSICLVAKKKWLWYVSLALAAVGTVQMILVWL